MDGMNIDGVRFTGFVNNKNTSVQNADKRGIIPLGHTNAVKSDGLYEGMGLKLSPEAATTARMKEFFENDPRIQLLNKICRIQ